MRMVDADAYSNEMRKRQKACLDAFLESTDKLSYTEEEYWGGMLSTFAEAKLTLDSMPTIGGWISVKAKLPEPPAQCLVYSDKSYRPRGMETATYTNLGWMTAAYFPEITHWMPLPEPPKEDDADEAD